VTWYAGLPVTTVARTIADAVSSGLPREQILLAIHQALARGLVDRQTLSSYARRRGGNVARVIEKGLTDEGNA
jgi:hypothetical protein